MRRTRRLGLALAAAALGLNALGATASAGIWTPINSGETSGTINSIDYQADDRFWYATTNGKLAYREAGVFKFGTGTGLDATITFNEVEFQPGGQIGIAVGNSNNVWRSTDGGRIWTRLNLQTIKKKFDSCSQDQESLVAPGDMFAVAWGSGGVVYIGGANRTVMRSDNSGQTFEEINKRTGVGCAIDDDISDIEILSSGAGRATEKAYFQAREAFGTFYFTADGLQSQASQRGSTTNATDPFQKFAVDPANVNRAWAVGNEGFTGYYRTEDGFASKECICSIANANNRQQEDGSDVGFAGGTTVIVMKAGQIATSVDGRTFFYQYPDGDLATKDWFAVDLYDAKHAAVGGRNGALIVTTQADTVPDIVAPTVTLNGPATAVAGQPVTFTATAADNAGGSGVDPNGFTWATSGLSQTSTTSTATYTFPTSGFFTVRVRVKDVAGNVSEEASKSINITAAAPPVQPTFTLPASSKPPITGGGVRRVRGKYVLKVKGTFKLPPGFTQAQACNGTIILTVKKGTRLITARTTKLNSKCGYRKTIQIARSKIGKARKLRLTVRFGGNAFLASTQKTYTIKVKR